MDFGDRFETLPLWLCRSVLVSKSGRAKHFQSPALWVGRSPQTRRREVLEQEPAPTVRNGQALPPRMWALFGRGRITIPFGQTPRSARIVRHICCEQFAENGCPDSAERRRTVLHVLGYGSLIMFEAISFAASVSSEPGGSTMAATLVGLLGLVPTANHCADRMFARLTRGLD